MIIYFGFLPFIFSSIFSSIYVNFEAIECFFQGEQCIVVEFISVYPFVLICKFSYCNVPILYWYFWEFLKSDFLSYTGLILVIQESKVWGALGGNMVLWL